jgi:hypothetical protein
VLLEQSPRINFAARAAACLFRLVRESWNLQIRNPKFIAQYEAEAGHWVSIQQSHGGSSRQARAVADGLAADFVTLALPSDIEGLSKRGLIAPDWKERFPHHSQPYTSTIVFVVRKTNPKHNFETNPSFGSGASAVAAVHDINAFKLNQLGEGNLKPASKTVF